MADLLLRKNGAWIAHVPKIQETLSTCKQPKAFITQSRFGPPLPIVRVSMIESYLCQDSKKEFNLNLVQIFLLFIDEKDKERTV